MQRLATGMAIGLLALAAASGAATLAIVPDETFRINASGDIFAPFAQEATLTIIGDSEGGATDFIYGDLLWSGFISTTIAASQTQHTSNGTPWTIPHPNHLGDGWTEMFNQSAPSAQSTVDQLQIATLTLIFESPGYTDFYWGAETDFFGLTSADLPSPAIRIYCCHDEVVPEPATGSLLALGLLGLALQRRWT